MAFYSNSQKSIGMSSDDKREGREEILPDLHERFVVFFCIFIVTEKIDLALKNKFQEFCSCILETKSTEIHTFIREHPENSSRQDYVILRLTSRPSTCIVLKEEADGFTAHICCQEIDDSSQAIEWISNLAKGFGYDFKGVHERESMRSFPDAVTARKAKTSSSKDEEVIRKDMIALPTILCKKINKALKCLSEILSPCICSDDTRNSEEAYEQASIHDQQIAFCNEDQTELKTDDPTPQVIHQNKIDSGHEQPNTLSDGNPTGTFTYYQLLLYNIADSLQFEEVSKLKNWVTTKLNIHVISERKDQLQILQELDKRKIINSSNLEKIKEFLEKVLRFDMVHLIDCYLDGDYSLLKYGSNCKSCCLETDSHCSSSENGQTGTLESSAAFCGKPRSTRSANEQDAKTTLDIPRNKDSGEIRYQPRGINEQKGEIGYTQVRKGTVPNNKPDADTGSNGKKLSKFRQPNEYSCHVDSSLWNILDDMDDGPWLCRHYKRRCYVKFDCCNQYWPCHRCHNNESKCGKKKLKSRDTKSIKCTRCGTEQQFGEWSQFCTSCSLKFAKYFCPSCKHLTGTDDHPYHCTKCGICRIHSDRSFHCDVCGVCLDTKLQNNHKCRDGSAHDACCICLEDAFSGCQILPCSHKVHKDCATLMIRSGITKCPVCRESFAHRLEKRPTSNPTKKGAKP